MRISAWWRNRNPDYKHHMVTVVLDPKKVQENLPGVTFISDIVIGDEGRFRIWGFRTADQLRAFSNLVDQKAELLLPTVVRAHN